MERRTLAPAALCALLCTLVGCDPGSIPDELMHVWRTDAPAYRDRHLEIQKEWIVFGTGGLGSDSYPVVGVDVEPSGTAETRYTIHYRTDDGGRLALRVLLTAWRAGDAGFAAHRAHGRNLARRGCAGPCGSYQWAHEEPDHEAAKAGHQCWMVCYHCPAWVPYGYFDEIEDGP